MLKGKKIIATVTNPLFHDRRMIRICTVLSDQGAVVILVGVQRANALPVKKQAFKQKLLNVWFKKGFLFYAEYNIRLFFYLLVHRFDLLISVDLDTIPAGYLAAGFKRRKRIFDAHEHFTEVPELQNKKLVRALWALIAKVCVGKYNMTVSDSLASVLGEKYEADFEVIRNLPVKGRYKALQSRKIPETGAIKLIYIGYLNEGRGLEQTLLAMKSLLRRFELILIGKGDVEEELRQQAEMLGLTDRVHFMGWVEPDEIVEYLKQGHIGLNLLESRSMSYYYSLANKTFDYLHFGIPAIHMNFPEYRRLSTENNSIILTDSLEPENLSALISQLCSDKEHYEKLSQNALKVASRLHWDEEKEKLLEFVNEIIEINRMHHPEH